MNLNYLDFEQPIAELEGKIEALKNIKDKADISQEIKALEDKSISLTKKIFASLSDWQIAQLARHPSRLYTLDYVDSVFDEFSELHGDRAYADDSAIVGGIAKLDGASVMFIGQQKGRTTQEKIKHNFGMPKPEGYRKALRLMKMAEKFSMPIVTFIDTPGAYPGIGAEERGQSEAIARNLFEMSTLATPIISVVIGEGGSGGALAIGVADRMMMFEYSIYSVISPEGCASILYKDASKASIAAESLKLTSSRLKNEGLIDSIISEPLGGIHRDPQQAKILLREALKQQLKEISNIDIEQLVQQRAEKLLSFGRFQEQG
ncbi:Acetyl-coenzyme A carboxyl transferase alpha chain (EC 6.4.1.2) [uncultured Gammaproteobacteria bacterium]|jgi:acetyl-CoA carboxylase carboxyl transferase subunit alpha|uniref:acetyl-CoA carboxylase carboxyltransferase subunit alpha n=1 Tax=thiotrophic endosymbiont of Bathymodiolus puteoserpentis (Logatchev) TaxID=343240 RepID=UPI0010B0283A|nr:acetyl-CoA carboxylase carboxyltransferase subunit alpha [thiotrophic endosymbiont of Bathymodiolus puteoserpentis (Logatchev)]CAC9483879.1 Acetyl-coenzyme A carboxyl transferase alpha chain (EC 6.4.1.2) [uncultured Gammaproteobacteria bacterium]CAC9485441.1 Acetyl-coenzyme A carboxyl transferase alpha chain (EC 6.4.1.2) [uncultured Gammaproteobacteria bacterium]CAC9574899.1 Acetyl-coenzyme A carboxyl transferase alpha chain (EC 6.4.1.2) [uncultured Gammaproteobacteria bacterium]CAC9638529.1